MPKGCHFNFAWDLLHSYFDECQKNEIYLIFTLLLLHHFCSIVVKFYCRSCKLHSEEKLWMDMFGYNVEQLSPWHTVSWMFHQPNPVNSFFIPRHTKSGGVLCYTLQTVECLSVHPSTQIEYYVTCSSIRSYVLPSVSGSLTSVYFARFSSNFAWTLISGRSGLGLQFCK